MTVKDFNQHKSNGGAATATTIDKIKMLKFKKVMAIEPRVAQVRHVANMDSRTHEENAQHRAKNATSVETKIILVCVVGPGTEKIP